jgi:hypothetical protein
MRVHGAFWAMMAALGVALALTACGDDNDASDSDAIQDTLNRLDDPSERCALLTDELLSETYDATRPQALARCVQDIADDDVSLEQSEILEIDGECARVSAADSKGREAIFVLVETDQGWRVNEIADPATPTPGEAECPSNP